MINYLIEWLSQYMDIPGIRLFSYLSFRSIFSVIVSLVVAIWGGKKIIRYLKKHQVHDNVRKLGLQEEQIKKGVPSMGGIIIIISILLSTLLIADLSNIAIQILLLCTLWMGAIGWVDDYIKVFKKKKQGLSAKMKIGGQLIFSLVLASVFAFHGDISVEKQYHANNTASHSEKQKDIANDIIIKKIDGKEVKYQKTKDFITTIPFMKNHELNYTQLFRNLPRVVICILYFFIIAFIVIAVSNAANLTDGLDGLLSGTSVIIGAGLGLLCYVSSNLRFAEYLNIMYIPYAAELVVFCVAFVGACTGFLWHNVYPAKIFMGDTGSLCIGGIIATVALLIRKELLIPIMCGIFFVESLSVILQVSYFKYTKQKVGQGQRIFLMSPLHHHYQKKGIHENTVVIRFWIISLILIVLSIATLKVR